MDLGGRRHILQALAACAGAAALQPLRLSAAVDERPIPYTNDEVVMSGHRFFGGISRGLGDVLETATRRWGRPNGYITGEEASGAFFGGLRYGEGRLFTHNRGEQRVFWQGPSLGFDTGADGDRTMMLIYHLPSREAIFQRFGGVDGSAYVVGGVGMTALAAQDTVLVPIRTGIGARFGVNIGYLKFTPSSTWNPF